MGKGVHIRVADSIDKRKTILESALLSANLLQKYEDIKPVRNEKTKQIALFKKTVKEVRLLFKELEFEDLPEFKLQKKEDLNEEISEEPEKPLHKAKLESDLEKIRNKLENLKI